MPLLQLPITAKENSSYIVLPRFGIGGPGLGRSILDPQKRVTYKRQAGEPA
jgi:hypothetical protein